MPGKEVFLAIEWQVIAELADHDLRDESWTGNPPHDGSLRRRCTDNAVLAVATSVLRSGMDMNFQFGRYVIEDLGFLVTDAVLHAPATGADLFRVRNVLFMPMVRQFAQVQFPTTTTPMCANWLQSLWENRFFRRATGGGFQIEEMLLAVTVVQPLPPVAVDPAFQTLEFLDGCLVRFLQLAIGSRRGIQHTFEFRSLLESGQQESLALGQIIGKWKGVIHNALGCSESS